MRWMRLSAGRPGVADSTQQGRRDLLRVCGVGVLGLLLDEAAGAKDLLRPVPIAVKHPANPLLTRGPEEFDARNVLHSAIIHDDEGYKLYYTGEAGPGYGFRSISVALSTDAIRWKKHENNPLIAPSRDIRSDEFDNVHCHTPSVLYRPDGKPRYQMWYAGYQNGGGNRIGYASSDDGLQWRRRSQPVLGYGEPGAFDDGGLRSPSVIVHPESGDYWMYYNGTRPQQHYGPTGLAVSKDGIDWEKRGRLCEDETRLLYGDVTYDAQSKLFRMWHDRGPAVTYAVSQDGLQWQDYDGPPLIQSGELYDRGYCQAPAVIYEPQSQSFYVYYNGATSGDPDNEDVTINLAIIPKAELANLPLLPAR